MGEVATAIVSRTRNDKKVRVMKLRIVSALAVMFALVALSFQSLAGPPDFSICDDLRGAARGLCHAGVAIGCADDDSSNACVRIAERFERLTGGPPPYSLPSVIGTTQYGLSRSQPFEITDPLGRMAVGDFVVVYPADGEAIDGSPASNIQISDDGVTLTGIAPYIVISGISREVFFRVARGSYDNAVFPDIAATIGCGLSGGTEICPR